MVLHLGNKTLEFSHFKYKCISCLFISESRIHPPRVKCNLQRWSYKKQLAERRFCKPETSFFSCFYSNLMIKVIFPIFLVYPLHLNILSHRSKTKRVNLTIHVWDIYIHIELNLIPKVVTLVLILIKLFPFLVSYEISVTMKQNYIWHWIFRKLTCIFKLKSQINCFILTI